MIKLDSTNKTYHRCVKWSCVAEPSAFDIENVIQNSTRQTIASLVPKK